MNEPDEADDTPISQQLPPTTDGYQTVGVEIKLSRKVIKFMKNPNIQFLFLMLMLGFGFYLFGLMQLYFVCKPTNDETTYYQCVTHTDKKPTKHKRRDDDN